jgi:hypothetical protein
MATRLLLLWLSIVLTAHAADARGSDTNSEKPLCNGNAAPGALRFDSVPPAPHSLSFCRLYAGETCCNATHTQYIMNKVALYYDDAVTPGCRDIATQLLCSPCHPHVGIGSVQGVCERSCHEWYHQCKHDFFTLGFAGNSLEPW